MQKNHFSKPAPSMQNISKCTFPGSFPGVSRLFSDKIFFSFTLLQVPTTFAKLAPLIQKNSKCTFPGRFPGVSRVFPRCFLGVPEHFFVSLFYFAKNSRIF